MKKHVAFFTCVFLLINSHTFSQTYITYHQVIEKAENAIVFEDYQGALSHYLFATSIVEYVFTKDLYNAAICAAVENDTANMFRLIEQCLKQGVDIKTFETNQVVFSSFFSAPQWRELNNNKDRFKNEYQKHLNKQYKTALDSLDMEDQQVRSHNMYYIIHRPDSKKAQKQRNLIKHTDSTNYEAIKQLINRFGYPNERNMGVGQSLSYFGHVCLWHCTDSAFLKVQNLAFLNGDISVERYVAKLEYTRKICFNYLWKSENKDECCDCKRADFGFPQSVFFESLKSYMRKTHNEYGFLFLYFN